MSKNEEGLSMREVDRVEVIREVLGRRLRQGEASERLGICVRQVKRLVRRYREEGARGLRSRRRGRRASNGIAPELRREILGWCGSATRTLHRPWRGRS